MGLLPLDVGPYVYQGPWKTRWGVYSVGPYVYRGPWKMCWGVYSWVGLDVSPQGRWKKQGAPLGEMSLVSPRLVSLPLPHPPASCIPQSQ